MPKTYNQRQIDQMRLEDAHTPQTPDAPDVTRFIRYSVPKKYARLCSAWNSASPRAKSHS